MLKRRTEGSARLTLSQTQTSTLSYLARPSTLRSLNSAHFNPGHLSIARLHAYGQFLSKSAPMLRSPANSPSIRTIAHMHARGSYFVSPPTSPAAVAGSPGRNSYFTSSPRAATPPARSAGIRSPMQMPMPQSPLHPGMPSPGVKASCRRPPMTSAIPVGHSPSPREKSPPVAVQPLTGEGRRRPSFKIDLPPRPAPTELLADQLTGTGTGTGRAGHTPYAVDTSPSSPDVETKITPHAERGAGRKLSTGALDMTSMRGEIDNIAYKAHADRQPASYIKSGPPTAFRDPFATAPARQVDGGKYMILRAPSGDAAYPTFDSPTMEESDPLVDGAGLGYTLNKLRAPTPWARPIEEEGEWLTAEDVSKMRFA